MPSTALGEIIKHLTGARQLEYQVRLPRGEIVIVPHALVQPSRSLPYPTGTRLRVTHELGQVTAATSDLATILAGEIRAIRPSPGGGVTYTVDLESGETIQISQDKLQPHPKDRPLVVGTEMELRYNGSAVSAARPLRETGRVKVTSVFLNVKHVAVQGKELGSYNIRVPQEAIRQLRVGEELELEITYSAHSEVKYTLARIKSSPRPSAPPAPASPPASSAPTAAPTTAQPRTGSSSSAAKPQATASIPGATAERIEGESAGLDPLVLQEVKQGRHRFEIVAFLERHARDGLVEWYRLKPGRPAAYAQPARPLNPTLRAALTRALPEFANFFKHQAAALDALRADKNLVIVTATASGKTLSYNPAIFEYLLDHPGGHVLYVFPLNALMFDQLEKVNELTAALKSQNVTITSACIRGGMRPDEREQIARAAPNIIMTNPEMLTVLLNQANDQWRAFFSGLKMIVIDEVHSYRGIFGVHMTGILRRLRIAARRLGADPRFVVSSATVHNPLDLAARLTAIDEGEFVLLDADADGSQQADKHWLVLNSDWGGKGGKFGSYKEVAADVFVELLTSQDAARRASPLNTILFCRSMREVRAIKTLVDQRLEQRAPHLKSKVKAYISAALTNEVKREIYTGLRSGSILGVISTNALEAGIDIGHLDACVIAGFPFSVMAMRQMAGRVGRKQEGLVCFIPIPVSSLDQYYSDHPDLLLTQPPEEFVVDPRNPYIARKHINAAAYPAGLSEDDLLRYWGAAGPEIARRAEQDGAMRHVGQRWQGTRRDYRNAEDAYNIANIRSNAQVPYVVCKAGACSLQAACFDPNGRPCEQRVTILDQQYVYRDCHPGAVYESPDQGLFRVTALDDAHRAVKVTPLADDCLERTSVEADIEVELVGAPRARKTLIPGAEMAWGSARITRLFTGYNEYTLQPARRCRRCRKEYDELIDSCPNCGRVTEHFFTQSKKERKDFPTPYQQGFRLALNTVACWLAVQPAIERELNDCSPCKLPGEQNRVLAWLQQPFKPAGLARLKLSEVEQEILANYHQQAGRALAQARPNARETLLFPGIYSQCLLSELRRQGAERKAFGESRALELFQAVTGYPVTSDLRHICRACQRSTLLPAMHTLEHAVSARYPSVALGDRSDIGAFTTLGHPATALPAIFWFDNYEGGLGAAEKIYEQFPRLLESGLDMLTSCTCTTLEGCPRCTFISDCSESNAGLSKPAGAWFFARLMGRAYRPGYNPFIYRKKRAEDFQRAYQANQTAAHDQGMGEEAPTGSSSAGSTSAAAGSTSAAAGSSSAAAGSSSAAAAQSAPPADPYRLLRVQRKLHGLVANKAFEVRSREIVDETPPVNAEQLNAAYQAILGSALLDAWQVRPTASPYEVLEVLPDASLKMIQQVYRAIALHVHPDANPERAAWATEMMKQLNAAYDRILKENK